MVVSSPSLPASDAVKKAKRIKLLLTDCDGVLTDGSVFYGAQGEVFKCFNIRDGMGVERLRNLAQIETGIITGELSPSVKTRAEKLRITWLELGCKDKAALLTRLLPKLQLEPEQIAFIGDDVNDLGIMGQVGLSACPADAMLEVRRIADYQCQSLGGKGAFRELAEFIISARGDNKQ